MKAAKLKAATLKAAKLKAARLEAAKLRAAKLKAAKHDPARSDPLASAHTTSANAPQTLSSIESPSTPLQAIAILLYGLPLVLILAALVPPSLVPNRAARTWQGLRVEVALCAGAMLLVEVLIAALYVALN